MPEIWVPYGIVEVAVDVKAENLGEVVEASKPVLDATKLADRLSTLKPSDRVLALLADVTPATVQLLSVLIAHLLQLTPTPELRIACPRQGVSQVKKVSEGKPVAVSTIGEPQIVTGTADGVSVRVPREFRDYQTRILLSETGLDPLFGFSGGQASLTRLLGTHMMAEAFRRSAYSFPKPGENTGAAEFASKVAEALGEVSAVEVLAFRGKLSEVYVGRIVEAHQQASKRFLELSVKEYAEHARAVVACPGDPEKGATLASSIRALWNVLGVVRDKGIVVLIAECAEGLGSPALRSVVTQQRGLESFLRKEEYVEGLEDLVYLRAAAERQKLVLVSTLPSFYAETRLGFKTAKKANEAMALVLHEMGARVKVIITPRADEVLLRVRTG